MKKILGIAIVFILSVLLAIGVIFNIFATQTYGKEAKWVLIIETEDGTQLTYDEESLFRLGAVYLSNGTKISRIWWKLMALVNYSGELDSVQIILDWEVWIESKYVRHYTAKEGSVSYSKPGADVKPNKWFSLWHSYTTAEDIESYAEDAGVDPKEEFYWKVKLDDHPEWGNKNIKLVFKFKDGKTDTWYIDFDDIASVKLYYIPDTGVYCIEVAWEGPYISLFGLQSMFTYFVSPLIIVILIITILIANYYLCFFKFLCRR